MNMLSSKNRGTDKLLSDVKIAQRKTLEDHIKSDEEPEITSKVEFEKMVLRQPSNSKIWIQYISFMQQEEGISAARKIAEKA